MEGQKRRRRRAALSCYQCRRRKIKCDRNHPCCNCITAKIDCHFESGFPRHRGTVSLPGNHDPQVLHQRTTSNTPDSEISPEASDPTETSQNLIQLHFGLENSQIYLNKTKTLRASHFLTFADQLKTIRAFYAKCTVDLEISKTLSSQGSESHALAVETADLLQRCKAQTKIRKATRPSRSSYQTDFSMPSLSREVADALSALYFRHFESTHRILHVSCFYAIYDTFWHEPKQAARSTCLLVYLVVLIGASLCIEGESGYDIRSQAGFVIHAAQTWLSGPLDKDRLTIVGLQIYCLVILARQLYSIGGDLTWISTGSLINRAMQMGLHRDPENLPKISIVEAELRRRLWATMVEFVLQSSLDSAMPPRLSVNDFDTKAPANLSDADLLESATDGESRPTDVYTTASTQLLLYSTVPVRLRALHLMNDLHAELSYRQVHSLGSEIIELCRVSRKFLEDNRISGASAFHQNLTVYLLQRFLIPLHSPFAMEAHKNPMFSSSLQVCLDSALAVLYPEQTDESFSRLMIIGGGMFREGLRHAVSVLSIPLITQAREGTHQQNPFRGQYLEQAVMDLMMLAIKRIQYGGEMNVKIHLFLSMILAEVNAIKAGKSVELAIAGAARNSVQTTYDLLCATHSASTYAEINEFSAEWLPGIGTDYCPGFDSFSMEDFLDF